MEPMVNIQEQFGDRLVVIDHPLVGAQAFCPARQEYAKQHLP